MAKTAAPAPLLENPGFKALLNILAENDSPGLHRYMVSIGQVSATQVRLASVQTGIAVVLRLYVTHPA